MSDRKKEAQQNRKQKHQSLNIYRRRQMNDEPTKETNKQSKNKRNEENALV